MPVSAHAMESMEDLFVFHFKGEIPARLQPCWSSEVQLKLSRK